MPARSHEAPGSPGCATAMEGEEVSLPLLSETVKMTETGADPSKV